MNIGVIIFLIPAIIAVLVAAYLIYAGYHQRR